jgi:hypothetical protein
MKENRTMKPFNPVLSAFIGFLALLLLTLISKGCIDMVFVVAICSISLAIPSLIITLLHGLFLPKRDILFTVTLSVGIASGVIAIAAVIFHFSKIASFTFVGSSLLYLLLMANEIGKEKN